MHANTSTFAYPKRNKKRALNRLTHERRKSVLQNLPNRHPLIRQILLENELYLKKKKNPDTGSPQNTNKSICNLERTI